MSTPSAQALPLTAPDLRLRLRHALEHAAHLLPAQGPIGVFIHHNTLHAFQHLPFEEAVVAASRIYGTEPFMTEAAYREQLSLGRISKADIEAVLNREQNGDVLPGRIDRRTLRQEMLLTGPRGFAPPTVQWHLEETDLLRAFRSDLNEATRSRLLPPGAGPEEAEVRALFAACMDLPARRTPKETARAYDSLVVDPDEHIDPLLIRLCAAFLDQGMAYWPMPDRELGFLKCVRALLSQEWALFPEHLDGLASEFRRQSEIGMNAEDVVLEMLDRLDVPEDEFDRALQAELLVLPGWAGMMYRLEKEPDLAPHCALPCSLMEFLAVRLTLKAVATANLSQDRPAEHGHPQAAPAGSPILAQAASRFDALQIVGIGAPEIRSLSLSARQRLVEEIDSFDEAERRRILHLAYEFNHESGILKPLAVYRRTSRAARNYERPSAQVFFCIDEREESTRRHLEEVAPDIETHGAAGFFGVAIDYAGIDDAHSVALCPVVVKPQHAVREKAFEEHRHIHQQRQRRRKLWAFAARHTSVGSRTLVRGWAGTAVLGVFALFPLLTRVLAPLGYGRLRDILHGRLVPTPRTELNFVRAETSERTAGELLQGFSIAEMIDRVAGMLGPAGLHHGLAPIVVILGHGSTSLNNPHESAHDCGACGGRRGGANARLFAAMANHPAVRDGLVGRGIRIPPDTWFVGGFHDTCSDGVDLYDIHRVPEGHRAELQRISNLLDRARALDAEERARRFETARPGGGPERALQHVRDRAEQLSEPRPEYGHASNAVCIVGRRALTRGLFLDRRAFLVSYDSTLDPEDEGLTRLLGAAVPVCAGINLEYYFSFVDNEGYGCGTKLPHNITGLIGVMNGPTSDLRTGLPWQMVEIHEPVRILFVVETTPERVMRVFAANPQLSELLENQWIRLATMDPVSGDVHVRRGRDFEKLNVPDEELPSARISSEWFRGKRRHLSLARITNLESTPAS